MCHFHILLIMDLGFFSARLRMLQVSQRDFILAPLSLKSNLSGRYGECQFPFVVRQAQGERIGGVGAQRAVPLREVCAPNHQFLCHTPRNDLALHQPFLFVVDLIAAYGQGQVHLG